MKINSQSKLFPRDYFFQVPIVGSPPSFFDSAMWRQNVKSILGYFQWHFSSNLANLVHFMTFFSGTNCWFSSFYDTAKWRHNGLWGNGHDPSQFPAGQKQHCDQHLQRRGQFRYIFRPNLGQFQIYLNAYHDLFYSIFRQQSKSAKVLYLSPKFSCLVSCRSTSRSTGCQIQALLFLLVLLL